MDLEMRHEPERARYVAESDGEVVSVVDYRVDGERRWVHHAATSPAFTGRGVAGELVRFALDDARSAGVTVVPTCPFVRFWIGRHPDYADLVDTA